MVRRRVLPLLLVGMLVAGCSSGGHRGSSDTSATRPPPSSTTTASLNAAPLDCMISTPSSVVPEDYEQLAGDVALPTSTSSRYALQTASGQGSLRLFAKTGLLIRAGVKFTIMPAAGWRHRAAAWWGNNVGGETIAPLPFRGGPCGGSGWLAFPGGFFVTRVGCVPFEVDVAGRTFRVAVGIGSPCAGQKPPPQPSTR